MLVFATVMGGFILFGTGVHAERHEYMTMGFGLLGALLFAGIVIVVVYERFKALKDQLEVMRRENGKDVAEGLISALDKAFAQPVPTPEEIERQHDHEILKAVIKDLGLNIDQVPTEEQIGMIATKFHEESDRFVAFTKVATGKYAVEFSATPVFDQSTLKPVPPAKKKLTPAEKKKREERNAERRAKRAEKAAAKEGGPTTTTTTTQPGQQTLPGVDNKK